jgi:hypothetical protein
LARKSRLYNSTGRILGIIEVKKEEFMKGFAQVSVQMESTSSRKDVDRVLELLPMLPNGTLWNVR